MIVADTNIVASLLIKSPQTETVRALLTRDCDWHLPLLWRSEWMNVLANYCNHGGMPLAHAKGLLDQSLRLSFLHDHRIDPDAVLDLSHALKITAYDAQFLALAKHLGTVCITYDKALRKAAPKLAMAPAEVIP